MYRILSISCLLASSFAQTNITPGTIQNVTTVVNTIGQDNSTSSSCSQYVTQQLLNDIQPCQPDSLTALLNNPTSDILNATLSNICTQSTCHSAVKYAMQSLSSNCSSELKNNRNVQEANLMVTFLDPMFSVICTKDQNNSWCLGDLAQEFNGQLPQLLAMRNPKEGATFFQNKNSSQVCTICTQKMVGIVLGWVDQANAQLISNASYIVTGLSALVSNKCGNQFVTDAKALYGPSATSLASFLSTSFLMSLFALYSLVLTEF